VFFFGIVNGLKGIKVKFNYIVERIIGAAHGSDFSDPKNLGYTAQINGSNHLSIASRRGIVITSTIPLKVKVFY